jgi:beta-mannosidase
VEFGDDTIEVGPRSAITIAATDLLGGFRDLTWAYRFGPPAYDVVHAKLSSADGWQREVFYLPLGRGRHRRSDLGLAASARRINDGEWSMTVTSRLFAQWVVVDVPGYTTTDSWFHVAPGTRHEVRLYADNPRSTPRGEVRALNSTRPTSIVVENKS